jgi:alanine dehydrogenase
MKENKALRKGLNVYKGKLTNDEVAKALSWEFTEYQAL